MKRFLIFCLIVILTISSMTTTASAVSSTKKMSLYRCIKSENTVYCVGLRKMYRVYLDTKEVVTVNSPDLYDCRFKLKGKYLYCTGHGQSGDSGCIYRINLKTGKYKILARKTWLANSKWKEGFVINGSKIYYSTISWKNGTEKCNHKVMKLNGKSKKKTNQKIKVSIKETNNCDYYVWESNGYYKDNAYFPSFDLYLSTPNEDIMLGTEISG